jgi:antitoxin component YwqK of YwqJK toxin-antitoxin module
MGKRAALARYVSDIPAGATAHELSGYRAKGHAVYLRTVEYRVGEEVVGKRLFEADGRLTRETPTRNGCTHGRVYEFHKSGTLSCLERYVGGVQHGTCYQWDEEGRLLGRYVLRNGTGLDVWRHRATNGRVRVSEIRTFRRGRRHGFEWWLFGRELSSETHFVDGKMHGIERSWNLTGKLDRTYPRYWVNDERVTKRQYLAAAAADPSLPRFRERDSRARRSLPAPVRAEVDRYSAS